MQSMPAGKSQPIGDAVLLPLPEGIMKMMVNKLVIELLTDKMVARF